MNVFVFGGFNVHHKGWLAYYGGTDGAAKLCYNLAISNDLTQMVNFPTLITDCDSHSPALWDLFISSIASICSTMAFLLLEKPDHLFSQFTLFVLINAGQIIAGLMFAGLMFANFL